MKHEDRIHDLKIEINSYHKGILNLDKEIEYLTYEFKKKMELRSHFENVLEQLMVSLSDLGSESK